MSEESTIAIVDYGMGNIGSVANMLKRVGAPSVFVRTPDDVMQARKIILPGVGAFDQGMSNLESLGLIEPLREQARRGTPLLGICLGMQLLALSSEEGRLPGLGIVDAHVRRLPASDAQGRQIRVPHMGWNIVKVVKPTRLLPLDVEHRFYFVHSYYFDEADPDCALLKAHYGIDFTAGIERGNLIGVQFHPEKSHKFGMRLLSAFAGWPSC